MSTDSRLLQFLNIEPLTRLIDGRLAYFKLVQSSNTLSIQVLLVNIGNTIDKRLEQPLNISWSAVITLGISIETKLEQPENAFWPI